MTDAAAPSLLNRAMLHDGLDTLVRLGGDVLVSFRACESGPQYRLVVRRARAVLTTAQGPTLALAVARALAGLPPEP